MTQTIQPRIITDHDGTIIDTFTGERAAPPPPKQTWRYTVADRPGMPPVTIGQRVFKSGTLLGEGNVALFYPEISRCQFTEADTKYVGPDRVEPGHIFPRLRSGAIVAELVADSD